MNEKDKAIVQALASIQNRLRHVYNQGFEDGRKAERKTGKWIDGHSTCSICKWYQTNRYGFVVRVDYNYCPNCGTKMEVDDADSN